MFHFKKSILISWKASPIMFMVRLAFEMLSVELPIILLYLSRDVINILSGVSLGVNQARDFYVAIIAITFINILSALLLKLNQVHWNYSHGFGYTSD